MAVSKDLAKRSGALTAGAKLPEGFSKNINLEAWARAIVFGEKYEEPNPNHISQMLSYATITGESVADVFKSANVIGLQEWLLDRPGETTGPMEMTELYVASSDYETGNPTFIIAETVSLTTGDSVKWTTGATNIQATLIGLIKLGHNPMRFQIKRGDSKDKGGRYLLHMLPPD